jgi:hypothetical protein
MKKHLARAGLLAVVLCACTAQHTNTPLTIAPPSSNATMTSVPNTVTPAATPSQTTAPPTLTATPEPTQPPATRPNDVVWQQMKNNNFHVILTATTTAGDGHYYAVYQIVEKSTPDIRTPCVFLFYQWTGHNYKFIEKIETVYSCEVVNWENASYQADSKEREILGLHGYWSDINNNGQPEFATNNYDGCVSCDDRNIWYSYYEVQGTQNVVDIAADLRGQILPGHILHTEHPLTIYATDFIWYDQHAYIPINRIYKWDATRYVDVSATYLDEYRLQAQGVVAQVQQLYGHPFKPTYTLPRLVWTIPVLYNEIELPRSEGLEAFLEVTDSKHWPGTERIWKCWLQIIRADAQIDFKQGVPFQTFPLNISGMQLPFDAYLSDLASKADYSPYDVSECK